ncbi:MAG: acyltransferase [Lentisphaeraceae bacterium]|nr:acyltransferase [Lentisphaeraceae bacterium]
MKSKNIKHIEGLDHLRAFAAVLVLLYHGTQLFYWWLKYQGDYAPGRWIEAKGIFTAYLVEGHTAVALFMVLSGFIFTVGTLGSDIEYFKFLKNRFLRTYPLFLLLIFVAVYSSPKSFAFVPFLQTVLFMGNSEGALMINPYTTMFWTIAVEWQFYLIFPFLLCFLNKYGVKYLVGLIVLALTFRLIVYAQGGLVRDMSYFTILGRLDQFLIGMLLAVFYKSRYSSVNKLWLGLFPVMIIAIGALLYDLNKAGGWPTESLYKVFWPIIEGAAWSVFILSYLSVSRYLPKPLSKCLDFIGKISYSTYLLHFIVIVIVIKKAWFIDIDAGGFLVDSLVTAVLVVLPITFVLSTLTFYLIEQPFLSLRVKYKKP